MFKASKRLLSIGSISALAGMIAIPLNPVNSKLLNLTLLICLAGAFLGITLLSWHIKPLRLLPPILLAILTIPFLLPDERIEAKALRQEYLHQLAKFEGTNYYWGGESPRGIDCSGLPRRALRNALLAYGIKHLNGRAFRSYAEQWWFDASAKALGEGYRNYTYPIGVTGSIGDMNYTQLIPGDLAVTTSGVHILVYAGDDLWIQADPVIGSVVTMSGNSTNSGWFQSPVSIHRWQCFMPN